MVQLSAPARLSRPQHCRGLVWYGDCPVVLCEDMSSSLFADARHMFLWASDESSCDKITAEVKVEHACKDLNKRLLRPQHCCGPSNCQHQPVLAASSRYGPSRWWHMLYCNPCSEDAYTTDGQRFDISMSSSQVTFSKLVIGSTSWSITRNYNVFYSTTWCDHCCATSPCMTSTV